MVNKNIPQLRFAGFDGEWNYHPLAKYLTTSCEKNRDNIYGKEDVMSVSREFGVVNQIAYQGRSLAGASLVGYGVAKPNDVIYTKSPLKDQPYGIIKANNLDFGIVSALYAIYHPLDTVHSQFVQTYFDSDDRLNNYLRPLVHKGAKNTLNIGDDDALKGLVQFPKKDEQIKITESINAIERQILQQQEKCEQLHKLKSALLDKLIPKAGHTTPEMRVAGFDIDWQDTPLAEIFTTTSEKGYPHLPILSASQELGMILRSENGIEMSYGTQNVCGYKRVLPGQYVIHLRSFQGGFSHSNIDGITSPAYTILKFKEPTNHDEMFWKYVFMSDAFVKMLESVTYGIRDGKSIKFEDVAKLKMLVPSYEEQGKIAKLLTTYNTLIIQNNNKLAHLNKIKSAMLDKLFV